MHGLVVRELKVVPRARGELIELLPEGAEEAPVRHAYLSVLYRGEMSGWHHHLRKKETLACLLGMLKLVLFDDREDSPTRGELRELFIGEHNPCSVSIPPGLKHAARAYGGERALVLVLSDLPAPEAQGDKVEDQPPLDYDWSLRIT